MITESSPLDSVPPPGDAMRAIGAGVGEPSSPASGAAITSNGAGVSPPGARVAAEGWAVAPPPAATGPAEGWGVGPAAGAAEGLTVGGAVVPAGVGGTLSAPSGAAVGLSADGLGLELGAPPAAGAPVVGVAGFPVAEAAGEGVVAAGAVAPPVEMGIETASAYDCGPPSTRPLAADTRTVHTPAVTSDAGTTIRSTLLRLSREHEAWSPLHCPDLHVDVWKARGKGRGGPGGGRVRE